MKDKEMTDKEMTGTMTWMETVGRALIHSKTPITWEEWRKLDAHVGAVYASARRNQEVFDARMKILERGLLDLHAHLNTDPDPHHDTGIEWARCLLINFDPLNCDGKPKQYEEKTGLELDSYLCFDKDRVVRFIDLVTIVLTKLKEKQLWDMAARCRIPEPGLPQGTYRFYIAEYPAHYLIYHILQGVGEPWRNPNSSTMKDDDPLFRDLFHQIFGVLIVPQVDIRNKADIAMEIERLLSIYGRQKV